MFKTVAQSVETALSLKTLVANANHCEVIIAPVFTSLKTVADRLEGSNIRVAAQNCSTEPEEGAQTGEIAAFMLRDVGATHVIIGHSERRQFYFETDTMVRRKVQTALASVLTPIICVGESLSQRDQGIAEQVVSGQLSGGLSGLTASDLDRIILAYEPVWAIGTGRNATPEQAQAVHAFLRARLSPGVRILYGGSVKASNAAAIFAMPDVDGGLIGGASLVVKEFLEIVRTAQ